MKPQPSLETEMEMEWKLETETWKRAKKRRQNLLNHRMFIIAFIYDQRWQLKLSWLLSKLNFFRSKRFFFVLVSVYIFYSKLCSRDSDGSSWFQCISPEQVSCCLQRMAFWYKEIMLSCTYTYSWNFKGCSTKPASFHSFGFNFSGGERRRK